VIFDPLHPEKTLGTNEAGFSFLIRQVKQQSVIPAFAGMTANYNIYENRLY
jgi:hypothetical protein